MTKLYVVSSTRLRYESEKPDTYIELYFEGLDSDRPSQEWSETMKLNSKPEAEGNHQFYTKQTFALHFTELLNKNIN